MRDNIDNLYTGFKAVKCAISEFMNFLYPTVENICRSVNRFGNQLEEQYLDTSEFNFHADDNFGLDEKEQEKYLSIEMTAILKKYNVSSICRWKRTLPNYVSVSSHYNCFLDDIIKLNPVLIRISTSVIPIISFSNKWKSNNIPSNGDYLAGNLNGVPVVVNHDLQNLVIVEGVDDTRIAYIIEG